MRQYKITFITLLMTFIMLPASLVLAQEVFSPDRPGIGDGSYVLAPRTGYFESGVEYAGTGNSDEFSFGQVLFRQGILPGVEFRALLNSFVLRTLPGDDETGIPDPGLGLKVTLWEMPGNALRLSGLGSITVPTGSPRFSDDEWVPSAALLADYTLSDYWSIGTNLGYAFGPGVVEKQWKLIVTPSYSIPGTGGYGIYFGYAGFYTDPDNRHIIEAGATKQLRHGFQLDVNSGINADNGDLFVGLGLAVQL